MSVLAICINHMIFIYYLKNATELKRGRYI
nr:MAG TPA: hypothetical protein [Caudoviricetes sp.]